MQIQFFNADSTYILRGKTALKTYVSTQVKKEAKKDIVLTYVFCSDKYLLDINKRFLQHDYYTDIITFPLGNSKEVIEGEIYISIDRVRDNAKTLGVAFTEELHRVLFHGVLHLLGYKDKSKAQEKEMRKMEDKWLKGYERFLAKGK